MTTAPPACCASASSYRRKRLSCGDDDPAQGPTFGVRGRFPGRKERRRCRALGRGGQGLRQQVVPAPMHVVRASGSITFTAAAALRTWTRRGHSSQPAATAPGLRSYRVRDERLGAVARQGSTTQLRDRIRLLRNGFLRPHHPTRLPPRQAGNCLRHRHGSANAAATFANHDANQVDTLNTINVGQSSQAAFGE